jgi:hypothetical protein
MGGYGSSRWGPHRRRPRVEESLALDAAVLALNGAAIPGTTGVERWTDTQGREVGSIAWRRVGEFVHLGYDVTTGGVPRAVVEPIRIIRLPKPFGGYVWGFQCPIGAGGATCARRVLRLHLPPGSMYFGCRGCHALAYRSSLREEEPLCRALARMGTPVSREVVRWMMSGGVPSTALSRYGKD